MSHPAPDRSWRLVTGALSVAQAFVVAYAATVALVLIALDEGSPLQGYGVLAAAVLWALALLASGLLVGAGLGPRRLRAGALALVVTTGVLLVVGSVTLLVGDPVWWPVPFPVAALGAAAAGCAVRVLRTA